jgi:hypothetical protein
LVTFAGLLLPALGITAADSPTERLHYTVEWRLIHAGDAVLEFGPSSGTLKLESAGMVSTLYKIQDTYRAQFEAGFCTGSTLMDAREGSRHRETTVQFDRNRNWAYLTDKDLDKNSVMGKADVQTPHCVHDVVAGLLQLRRMKIEPGQSVQLPVSNGRKSAAVKVEAQEREQMRTPAGTFKTVRYEINILNDVVYARQGRVFVWLTDDERRIPVQIRVRTNFPLGTITLELAKEEHP